MQSPTYFGIGSADAKRSPQQYDCNVLLADYVYIIFTLKATVFSLTLQKSRVLQIQGVKGAAVVIYRKPLTTLEMGCHRLSRGGNNMAAFH